MSKNPQIIPRAKHGISRSLIDPCAVKVLYRLKSCGYDAYLVGGCVRDLLLGHRPKDFDIATNAKPEEIKKIFRNCRLIGRRFRLAHIIFGRDHIIEVATFRGHHDVEHTDINDGMILRDNVYGTIEEDADRRDFTINALYYNIKDFTLIDYHEGLNDLQHQHLRMIGDAKARYKEDPVRMIRAVRIASKLNFHIIPSTANPIKEMKSLINQVSSSRLFEEVLKLFHTRHATQVFSALREHELFEILFPETHATLQENSHYANMIQQACIETDRRLNSEKTVSAAFLFAVLLWPVVESKLQKAQDEEKLTPVTALLRASREVYNHQVKVIAIPRRLLLSIHDIWYLQHRLVRLTQKHVRRCLQNKRFRAGYDLLLLRHSIDPSLKPFVEWWTNYQSADKTQQETMIVELPER